LLNSTESPRLLASYGRRHGRKLRTGKQGLIDTLLPKLSLSLPEQGMLNLPEIFPGKTSHWLEIGFGGGEHLAHQAKLHPDTGILGCEPYVNGIADLLRYIDTNELNNIRVFTEDARLLLDTLPDNSIERVFILYPDPWPKMRHRKRRLISIATLDRLARVMKPGARLQLATDDPDYGVWMLEQLLTHPAFTWLAKDCDDWITPPLDWISTRYEQKALAAGRPPTYLAFMRSKK
jgi:tRNA (guanine-N7-)-methyltransferase